MSYFFYAGIAITACYVFYIRMAAVEWDESERRKIIQEELHLGSLLQLLEARDVRQMTADPKQRATIYYSFAAFLLEDIQQLKSKTLGVEGRVWLVLFYLGYGSMKLKSLFGWGRNDLNFLAGIELALIRSLRRSG